MRRVAVRRRGCQWRGTWTALLGWSGGKGGTRARGLTGARSQTTCQNRQRWRLGGGPACTTGGRIGLTLRGVSVEEFPGLEGGKRLGGVESRGGIALECADRGGNRADDLAQKDCRSGGVRQPEGQGDHHELRRARRGEVMCRDTIAHLDKYQPHTAGDQRRAHHGPPDHRHRADQMRQEARPQRKSVHACPYLPRFSTARQKPLTASALVRQTWRCVLYPIT